MTSTSTKGSRLSESNDTEAMLSTASSVKTKFWSTLLDGLSNLASDSDRAWYGPCSKDYELEDAMIQKCGQPILWGTGTTCLCFLSFRLAGNRHFMQFRSRIMGTPTTRKPMMQSPDGNAKQWKSYSERVMEEKKEKYSDILALPTDMALSVMLGISIGAINTDPPLLKNSLETAPLLPGRSLISEHLCADMTNLFHQVDPKLWEKDDDKVLDALRIFVENCRKREELAQEIRHEQQLPDGYLVSIPHPGVLD
jgi:hypothetical protein